MNQEKTGRFIAAMRKKQNMTQKQLAGELGISDKTVSKWECGNGMPDLDVIGPLCRSLKISVNELISGETLSTDNYSDFAEENMMNLLKETSVAKHKNLTAVFRVIMAGITFAVVFAFMLMTMTEGAGRIAYFIDFAIILLIIMITFVILLGAGMFKDFGRALSVCIRGSEGISDELLKQAAAAVELAEKTLVYTGLCIAAFYAIVTLHMLDDPAVLGPSLAFLFLSIFYGFIGALLLLPVKGRLRKQGIHLRQ